MVFIVGCFVMATIERQAAEPKSQSRDLPAQQRRNPAYCFSSVACALPSQGTSLWASSLEAAVLHGELDVGDVVGDDVAISIGHGGDLGRDGSLAVEDLVRARVVRDWFFGKEVVSLETHSYSD